MARFKGSTCARPGCKIRVYKGTHCSHCTQQQIEQKYSISFPKGSSYAKPSAKFWKQWHTNRVAVERDKLRPERDDHGNWRVLRIHSHAKW